MIYNSKPSTGFCPRTSFHSMKWIHLQGFSLVTKLCQILTTLWTIAHPAPLFMGFSSQEYWSGLPFLSPEDLSTVIQPASPALSGRFFTTEPPGKPINVINTRLKCYFMLMNIGVCNENGLEAFKSFIYFYYLLCCTIRFRNFLKHVKYHVWNELPVQVRCTILDAWGWCTGTTQRDDMGWEEGSGWGTHVYLWQIHFDIWQN